MKTIYKIARTELQTLFYSPVAWMILVIFAFQAAMVYTKVFESFIRYQEMGWSLRFMTSGLLASPWNGLLPKIQSYLYLYIPLLTMGLMSRELGSGSIKLLYSSPVTNTQIILGKYLSMMIYGLAMIAVLFVPVLYGWCTIKDFDMPHALTGLLGMYLLICAYSAVGLFMSCLTSYQIVAAVMTLAMLTVLSYVKTWWQEQELMREITYWLSIDGRASEFIRGLICSEDLLYFIIVSAFFLVLTIIRLQSCRQKAPWMVTFGKYAGVIVAVCLLGYITSRPSLMGFYDATETKTNTLTPNSQKVIAQTKGPLTITTYVNIMDDDNFWYALPRNVKQDQQRFRQYLRFKPDIKMKYVYYYDTVHNPQHDKRYPGLNTAQRAKKFMEIWNLDSNLFISAEEIRKQIDLFPESNKFVRLLERESGEKTFLRIYNDLYKHPFEPEITAAFKRISQKLPKVGFLTGHGERGIYKSGERDYQAFTIDKPFRNALVNQGFDVEEVSLDQEIPSDIRILVISEMRSELTPQQKANLDKYIAEGRNLMILSEPKRSEVMSPLLADFGVKLVPGTLVETRQYITKRSLTQSDTLFETNDVVDADPTKEAADIMYPFIQMRAYKYVVVTPGASGLEYTEDKGYKVTPLFVTDSLVWNELGTTNFVDDTARLDSKAGEVQGRYTTGLALSRKVGEREQRIMILGDADCISTGELSRSRRGIRASNFSITTAGFFWLSDNEVPIDVRRPNGSDTAISLSVVGAGIWKVIFSWIIPIVLAITAFVIWFRRRGR